MPRENSTISKYNDENNALNARLPEWINYSPLGLVFYSGSLPLPASFLTALVLPKNFRSRYSTPYIVLYYSSISLPFPLLPPPPPTCAYSIRSFALHSLLSTDNP